MKTNVLSKEYRENLGSLMDLTERELELLKKRLRREIDDWKESRSPLDAKLARWNDLVENVIYETDWPYEGASNYHVPLVAIYMRVYHSILTRSILSSDTIWYSVSNDETMNDELPNIDQNLNYNAREEWNIAEGIGEGIFCACRDGLCAVKIPYVEEYEKNVRDVLYIESSEHFLEHFQDESAMEDPAQWEEFRLASETATPDEPLEIPIVFDKVEYKGPKAEIVELADFVVLPASAKDLSARHCRGYGHRTTMRRAEIRKMMNDGIWDKDETQELLDKMKTGSDASDYTRKKDSVQGISRSGKSDDYEYFELVYRFRFPGDKYETKLLLVYFYDADKLPYRTEYPYRTDFYALLRIGKKPNLLIGDSLPADLEDSNAEVDDLHNGRINSRRIADIPSFKGKKSKVKEADTATDEFRWRPGVMFWLEDPDSFMQFQVQPGDYRSGMQEEANTMRIASLLLGVEPFSLSGNPTADNPDAPGNKTGMLIAQSNMRMDDPLMELRKGIGRIGEICLSHEYQFGPSELTHVLEDPQTGIKSLGTVRKSLLSRVKAVRMAAVTITMNPETEFAKAFQEYQLFVQEPIIAKRLQSRWYLLMRALQRGRIHDRKKILPSLEELRQEEIDLRKQAMLQIQQERQTAIVQQGEERKKAFMGKVKQEMQVRRMAGAGAGSRTNGA